METLFDYFINPWMQAFVLEGKRPPKRYLREANRLPALLSDPEGLEEAFALARYYTYDNDLMYFLAGLRTALLISSKNAE